MNTTIGSGLAAFVLAGALQAPNLLAQNHVSYPQDTTTGGNGNNIAFGVSSGASLDEGRYQQLIPRTHLPSTGAVILGVEVVSRALQPHTLTHESLQITLSHDARTQLDPSAATNLPAPVVVLAVQNFSNAYAAGQWSAIQFTTPFVYDGVSDLVIDVQKVFDRSTSTVPVGGSSMSRAGHPGRPDLPDSRWAFGSYGSGAATSSTLNFFGDPLLLRLQVGGLPTTVLRGDRVGNTGNFFALANPFEVEVRAASGDLFGVFASTSFQAPMTFPLLSGTLQITLPQTLKVGLMPATGVDVTTITLPNNNAFVGTHLTFQSGVVPSGAGSGLWTNATDMFVNP